MIKAKYLVLRNNWIIVIFLLPIGIFAQGRLYCKEARVSFFSKTAMENIEAQNNKGLCVWDTGTGALEFSVLIKGFEFDRALMQEHFNENYMESDKYPKAVFKGKLIADKKLIVETNSNFTTEVSGTLTIHGVSRQITVPVETRLVNGVISARANFKVTPQDYKISIPAIVADKINKTISIAISVPRYSSL